MRQPVHFQQNVELSALIHTRLQAFSLELGMSFSEDPDLLLYKF